MLDLAARDSLRDVADRSLDLAARHQPVAAVGRLTGQGAVEVTAALPLDESEEVAGEQGIGDLARGCDRVGAANVAANADDGRASQDAVDVASSMRSS